MTLLERILELELAEGTPDELGVWQDLAREHGFKVDVIADDEAEHDRVRSATREHHSIATTVWIIDRIPLAARPVSVGGLRAIQPSEGGDLKRWMAARVARLWRAGRGAMLFAYVAKRGNHLVRKRQRWETRAYVDLAIGDSPAHLSGFGSTGDSDHRNVAAPRHTPPKGPPEPRQADLSERW